MGHAAPIGVVVLRNDRKLPSSGGTDKPWVLYFDATETRRVEDALPNAIDHPGGVRLAPSADGAARYDPGDLAHEICHRYVDWIANQSMAKSAVPDLVNEAAAISCEPFSGRKKQIAALALSGHGAFSSEGLFDVRNPLAVDPAMLARAGVPVEDDKPHTVTFALDAGSPLFANVAGFYGRAAVLQEYMRRNRCNGLRSLGSLVQAGSQGKSFDSWLAAGARTNCLPDNRQEFDKGASLVANVK